MAPPEGDSENFSSLAGTRVLLEVLLVLGSWGGFKGEVLSGTFPGGRVGGLLASSAR